MGNSKKWKDGSIFIDVPMAEHVSLRFFAERKENYADGSAEIEFSWQNPEFTFGQILEHAGRIPIPPYLNRESEYSDLEDYQTVYARVKGSVAAPTAGLHFTPRVFEDLEAHAVKVDKVTLHVGAGTFRPVKSENIGDHAMHAEPFTVSRELLEDIIKWKEAGRPVIAVGTTSVRTLESLPYIGRAIELGNKDASRVSQWDPYESGADEFDTVEALKQIIRKMDTEGTNSLTASTSIMIAPGFRWRIVEGMVTNFHQPKSTLLLLVSSFMDGEWRGMYEAALASGYRFLSYGDASLLLR